MSSTAERTPRRGAVPVLLGICAGVFAVAALAWVGVPALREAIGARDYVVVGGMGPGFSTPYRGAPVAFEVRDAVVDGEIAYLLTDTGEAGTVILRIVGLDGPSGAVREIGSLELGPGRAKAVAVGGEDRVFASHVRGDGAASEWTVAEVDVADPTQPRLLAEHAVGGSALLVLGMHVYLASGSDLVVFNAAAQPTPSIVARLTLPGRITDLAVWGDHLFLASERGIQIVNVRDRDHPARVSEVAADRRYASVALRGSVLLAVQDDSYQGRLDVFRLERRGRLEGATFTEAVPGIAELGSVRLAGAATEIRVADAVAYVTVGQRMEAIPRFQVLDLRDGEQPRVVGTYAPPDVMPSLVTNLGNRVLALGRGLWVLESREDARSPSDR
jgi:hypothetical protein